MRNIKELLIMIRFLVEFFTKKIRRKSGVEAMVIDYKDVIRTLKRRGHFRVSGEYPKNYVSEDKAYEFYREGVKEVAKAMSFNEKKERVLKLIDSSFQGVGGRWIRNIEANLPEASARDVNSFRYDEETGEIYYSYTIYGDVFIPESFDGYRRARVIDTEGSASVTTNINNEEWLDKVVASTLTGCSSCREKWLEENGYKVIDRYRCGGSDDVSYTFDKLYKELLKVNTEVAATFRCLYSDEFDKHNKEVLEEIKTLEKEKEEVIKMYSDRKEDIELYNKYYNATTYTVERDRKGNGVVVFKRNDKIRFFDRGIKHPKAGDTIVIKDEVELAKVKIIKDYVVIPDMDKLGRELIFRSSVKDNWNNPIVAVYIHNNDMAYILEKLDNVINRLKDTLI